MLNGHLDFINLFIMLLHIIGGNRGKRTLSIFVNKEDGMNRIDKTDRISKHPALSTIAALMIILLVPLTWRLSG